MTVIVCLLCQQLALAAYVCPMEPMPAQVPAMSAPCGEMGMAEPVDNPALCRTHCNPEHSVVADAVKLTVPSLGLPPPAITPIHLPSRGHRAVPADVPLSRSDPPPRLRFCSLQI